MLSYLIDKKEYRKRKIFAFLFGAIILAMIVLSNFIYTVRAENVILRVRD